MDNNLTPEQIRELQENLEKYKSELDLARQQQVSYQTNPQDKFIETLFDKGGDIFKEWTKVSADTHKYSIDKESEEHKEELKIINKLDTKEKLYKGILISICIVALLVSALNFEKAEVIIPVLSLIIGLLFKSNSLMDFFTHKGKRKDGPSDNE
jgi:hypothetical protein